MRALVVYESMFGNNARVAAAIVEGLQAQGFEALAEEVGVASLDVTGLDLLVVGCPNHGWTMPRPSTRAEAQTHTDEPLVSQGIGVREWLTAARIDEGQASAAYDTRSSHPKALAKFDHASTSIEKALRRAGARRATWSESFLVEDITGPLIKGELERAIAWGRDLARICAMVG